jgi:hypothetical protein
MLPSSLRFHFLAVGALLAVACNSAPPTDGEASTASLTAGRDATHTFIVGATVSKTVHGQVNTSVGVGFHDSSFDADTKAFCYVGKSSDVCGLVREFADNMAGEYSSGAHDTIDLKSCEVGKNDVVKVSYQLSDDYGGKADVTKEIEACDPDAKPTAAPATSILEAEGWAPDAKPFTVWPMVGFHDSSFDNDTKSFCYLGDVAGACAAIDASAAAMHEAYVSGAHDDIKVTSCAVSDRKVTVSYHLDDDYGGNRDAARTFGPCYVWGTPDDNGTK